MTGVVVFLAALIALLAIPVTLTFQFAWPEDYRNRAELSWAFGLVRTRILASESKPVSVKNKQPVRRITRARRPARMRWDVLSALRHRGFRRRITRFIGDVWHAVHKKDVQLRLRLGLGDPADTGQLWAVLGPLAGMLGSVQDVSIGLEPAFIDETLELDGNGRLRIIPLEMIYLAAALMLSPVIWRGIRQMRTVRQ